MAIQLTDRDKRTLKLGGVCALGILAFVYMPQWTAHWRKVRSEIKTMETTLDEVRNPRNAKQAGLNALVPVFQMPADQESQTFLFRDKFNEQVKSSGLNEEPIQFDVSKKSIRMKVPQESRFTELIPLSLSYKSKCRFDKLLDLLVALKGNPYCVGIESLKLECDPKKPSQDRGDLDIELTVSTFAEKKAS